IFPGIKLIRGVAASESDPEWGVSRGRLLPDHSLLNPAPSPQSDPEGPGRADRFSEALARSLVLVHGGMAQNVGPILNMVTEKYLLRGRHEWQQRQEARSIYEQIVQSVKAADVRSIGQLTARNWKGHLKGIIAWVSNQFTET